MIAFSLYRAIFVPKIYFMAVRVAVFDDNNKVRDALQMILSGTSGIEWAGGFPDCLNLLRDYEQSHPDVVLMDIQMPVISGIEAVKMLHGAYPEARVLMLTNFDDEEMVFSAICNGASGYLLKNTPPLKLIEAVEELYKGGAPMTPSIAVNVLKMFRGQQPPGSSASNDYSLSARELEVLESLVEGRSLKMVGDHLHISYDTVRTHIKHIYKKLHVFSLTEAVSKALKERLVG